MKTIPAPSLTKYHGQYLVTRPARGGRPVSITFHADLATAKKHAGKISAIAKITP